MPGCGKKTSPSAANIGTGSSNPAAAGDGCCSVEAVTAAPAAAADAGGRGGGGETGAIGGGDGIADQAGAGNAAGPSNPLHQPKPKGVQVRRTPVVLHLALKVVVFTTTTSGSFWDQERRKEVGVEPRWAPFVAVNRYLRGKSGVCLWKWKVDLTRTGQISRAAVALKAGLLHMHLFCNVFLEYPLPWEVRRPYALLQLHNERCW